MNGGRTEGDMAGLVTQNSGVGEETNAPTAALMDVGEKSASYTIPLETGTLHLRLLLAAANKALEIEVDRDATVDDLRQKVFAAEDFDPKTKRIRFIFAGKLIENGPARLTDYNVADGAALHCAVSDIKEVPQDDHGGYIVGNPGDARILLEPVDRDGREDRLDQETEAELEESEIMGTFQELFLGLFVGFSLGPMMLLLCVQPTVVPSRKWRVGFRIGEPQTNTELETNQSAPTVH